MRSQRLPGTDSSFEAMLEQFVQNAKESLPGGSGTIDISTSVDSRGWVVLTIGDSGCGMSQEVQRRAGEPFFTHQGRTRGRRVDDRPAHLAEASGRIFDREQAGRWNPVRLSILPQCRAFRNRRRDQVHDRHHRLWNGQLEERSEGDRGGRARPP